MFEAFTDFNLFNCFGVGDGDNIQDLLNNAKSPEVMFRIAVLKEDEVLTSHCPYAFEHSLLDEDQNSTGQK